ncbi:MAG: dihydrofolate reductase [Bacteroidales bacterium]|nr:dihydrofolate reductase [Bacteroidales bacterium]MBR5531840.1 dihydrofolate reductase [Bacteroidales bacterium]
MRKLFLITTTALLFGASLISCSKQSEETKFNYNVDKFADLQILRYQVPGFEELSLNQKLYIYYLTEAAQEGRDILFDQNGKYNLAIRRTLEAVYNNYNGDKENADYKEFVVYLKRVWFSNGIHHHYATDKFVPGFSQEFFAEQVKAVDPAQLPVREGSSVDELIAELTPVIFDKEVMPKRVNLAAGEDLVQTSAGNYYDGVTQKEAEDFYAKMRKPNDNQPISYGLNSRLVKRDGKIYEEVYKIGGRYTKALERIVYWLELAKDVAENDEQRNVIDLLIEFNKTGDLKTFDEYAVAWVQELGGNVDFVCGFTEVYGDPLGLKASWEASINFKNIEASARTETISANAQWFEDNSPVDPRFKKETVKGVTAKVITVAMLGGDCYPSTPIGINLPNADWIRRDYGSKSVTIENITYAYDQAALGNGFKEEFVIDEATREIMNKYGFVSDNLHTDLHECLGHGSGKLLPGVDSDALKSYASTLEETRADLFAMYYMSDPKIMELGLLPDKEAYKANYYSYIMNGLMTQLTRIELGNDIEESHMRNRQLIAKWCLENGAADNVISIEKIDGKSYVKINDYDKLRGLFGKLLAEIQRIKSEGDYEAGKALVEKYAVKVDLELHKEVLERYKALNLAPYKGFVNPKFSLVEDAEGNIVDVEVSYNEGYAEQMLRYAKDYSALDSYND